MSFYVGQRLSFEAQACTVRYIGILKGTMGEWLGVEWDDPSRGKHNGCYRDERYFWCQSKYKTPASFIRPSRKQDVSLGFLDALRKKYVDQDAVQDPTQGKEIYFNGKLAEEVGFDKIRQQLADLCNLRVVILDLLCIKGQVTPASSQEQALSQMTAKCLEVKALCPNITHLELRGNLFEYFADIVAICSALHCLTTLDISQNRFASVASWLDEPSAIGRKSFASVTDLRLDQTLLDPDQTLSIIKYFPCLRRLSISGNELVEIVNPFPDTIDNIDVSHNSIDAIDKISALTKMKHLKTLSLHGCGIETLTSTKTVRFDSVTSLNVADTRLAAEDLYRVDMVFPYLKSLKCSGLDSSQTLSLIARIGSLQALNSTQVSTQIRTNAELYYLSTIASKLAASPESEKSILDSHPRWEQLCSIHGEPVIDFNSQKIDQSAKSLRAGMLRLSIYDFRKTSDDKGMRPVFEMHLPKSITTHRLYMYVSRRLVTNPVCLQISLKTMRDASDDRLGKSSRTRRDARGEDENDDRWTVASNTSDIDDENEGACQVADKAMQSHVSGSVNLVKLPANEHRLFHWIDDQHAGLIIQSIEDQILASESALLS